ncbi:MAG: hypothetical protein IT376_00540 [Polyangiaceae bacterium]|nr:hypothetical protein [Polyangiaceae bacterium]
MALSMVAVGCGVAVAGCGEQDRTRTMDPIVLGITSAQPPIYDDGEVQLYEAKRPVPFPILAPSREERQALWQVAAPPFPRGVWFHREHARVQITWTLTNLDTQDHTVELLLDPWSEFGRYWPGLALVDADNEEFLPNLSGIDILFELPGTASPRGSRRHGTFTYEDMEELAIDFATAYNVIENLEPPPLGEDEVDPRTALVNHAFHRTNRSAADPFVAPWVPALVPGLTGIDLGLRTREPANIAVEIVVEVVDTGSDRVAEEDDPPPTWFGEPDDYVTLGGP